MEIFMDCFCCSEWTASLPWGSSELWEGWWSP